MPDGKLAEVWSLGLIDVKNNENKVAAENWRPQSQDEKNNENKLALESMAA